MAGTPISGALTLRSGEPFVLRVVLKDSADMPQLLSGRTFSLFIARVGATTADLRQDSVLSDDALSAVISLTGIQTAALFADFGARAASYAIVEQPDHQTRSTGRLAIQPSGTEPSNDDPIVLDLPYWLANLTEKALTISQEGARGLSAAEQFAIGGLDGGDPMTKDMFAGLQAPALEAATIADIAAANADTKAVLAQAVVDAQAENMAAIVVATTATAADREQTNLDQIRTGQDRVQTGLDTLATGGDVVAANSAALAAAISQGHAAMSETNAANSAGLAAAMAVIYPSDAAGIAAVADGVYFAVAGTTGSAILATLKRRNGAAADYVNDFSSYSALAAALTTFGATAVQNAADITGHLRVDKYGGVIEEVTSDGARRITPYGEIRQDSATLRVLFDEATPDASTFTVQRLSDGKLRIGAASIYITLDPAGGAITVPGLDIGNTIGGVTFATASGATSLTNGAGGKIVLGADAIRGQIGALGIATYGTSQIVVDAYGGVIEENYLDGTAVLPGGFYADGNSGKIYDRNGAQIAPFTGVSSENFPAEYISRKNQAAELRAAILRNRVVSPAFIAALGARYSLFVTYGQSNSNGQQSFPPNWPSDIVAGRTLGCCMIGNSVHGNSATGIWAPIGSAAFNPMVATVPSIVNNAVLLSPTEIDALLPTDGNRGQTIGEAAVGTFAFLRLAHLGLDADASRRFVLYTAGVGGHSAAELSKGASPDLYRRLRDGALVAKSIADAEGASIRAAALIISQGEDDSGFATPAETWKSQWRQIRADHHADTTIGVFGQSGGMVPAFVMQIGGPSGQSPGGLTIANAQLDMALNDHGFYLFAGYRGSRKGSHYDANTTAWNGQRIGRMMFELFCLGRAPVPFAPYEIETKGNQMLVTFTVPTPPIQWLSAYYIYTLYGANDIPNKGFFPYDAAGDLSVTDVSIVGSSSILITCARPFGASPALDYGRTTASPKCTGNLFDSTDFELLSHRYVAGSSYSTSEAGVFYVNQLFPPEEGCLLFSRPATPL
jgi:hypothetical protein